MDDPSTSDVLQQLDQRHEHMLDELDNLNQQIEQVLGSLGKRSEAVEPAGE